MTNNTAHTSVDSELVDQLSAYLDGELGDAECRQVEQLLSADARARETLHQLQQASQALDVLPATNADPAFARSTVEMVAVSLADEAMGNAPSSLWGRLNTVVLAALILGSTLVIGYRVADLMLPDPNRQLVRDLAVVKQLDQLRQIDSLEFLEQLNKSGAFDDEPVDLPEGRP